MMYLLSPIAITIAVSGQIGGFDDSIQG